MKAVLVFCEGHADVVFARRSLCIHRGCDWVNRRIGELPTPFGPGGAAGTGLIARQFERQEIESAKLQAALHPEPPFFASIVESISAGTIYFLVNALGKNRSMHNLALLEKTYDAIHGVNEVSPDTFDVSEYAVAFLIDANSEGVTATLSEFSNGYHNHFGGLSSVRHGSWVTSTCVPVGCFVFHEGPGKEQGTLEDHLAPMVKADSPERYAAAERFIDQNRLDDDEVSKDRAKRLKAVITTTGQFRLPSARMSAIIDRNSIPREVYQEPELSRELARFLSETPW